jgi:poly(hydroxyalkanoate) synthase III subunit E
MQTPFSHAGFQPDATFAVAAERFFELLKTCGMPATGQLPDWSALAAPLAGQFEQWLRLSQGGNPWFAAGAAAMPGAFTPQPWSFGPLPLGPLAPHGREAERPIELLGRLAQLQGQLAQHWSEVANSAAQRFAARLGSSATAPTGVEGAMKLYELWVNCAEEAYAVTAHKDDFATLQAELTNVGAALLLERRRHAETFVRAFALPTRSEVDALTGELKALRRQLEELTLAAPGVPPPAPRPKRRPPKGAASRGARRKRPRRSRR